jgi:hypothetical protein
MDIIISLWGNSHKQITQGENFKNICPLSNWASWSHKGWGCSIDLLPLIMKATCYSPKKKKKNIIHKTLAYILALWTQYPSHPTPRPMSFTKLHAWCSYSSIIFFLFSKVLEHMIPEWSFYLIANLGNVTTSGKTLANSRESSNSLGSTPTILVQLKANSHQLSSTFKTLVCSIFSTKENYTDSIIWTIQT